MADVKAQNVSMINPSVNQTQPINQPTIQPTIQSMNILHQSIILIQ